MYRQQPKASLSRPSYSTTASPLNDHLVMGMRVVHIMTQFVLIAAIAYAALVGALYVFQRNLMYHPGMPLVPLSETMVAGADVRRVMSEPGLELQSWYLPPKDGKPVIVVFHGNAGTIADRDCKAAPWHAAGYGVWLAGYRGFSGNSGDPTEQGLYADARAMLAALREDGLKNDDIILYGESLGTGIATHMAFELAQSGKPAKALILEAPLSSMPNAAQESYPFVPARWLVKDKYDNLAKIGKISAPLLIFHGDRDRVLAQSHGRRLFDAANEPKQAAWIEGGGHTDMFDIGAREIVQVFLDKVSAE